MSRFAQLSKPEPKDTRAILAFAEKETPLKGFIEVDSGKKKPRGQMAPAGMKRLTINLPEELHRKLRLRSVQEGTTATEMIVQLLKGRLK